MARLLLLDVINNETKEVECNVLNDFYEYLQCDTFDIANREIGRKLKRFDLYIDDEGLLKDNAIVSAVDFLSQPVLVGNIIFANHDEEGNTVDLSDEDIEYIRRYIKKRFTLDCPEGYNLLTYCEY